MVAEHSLHDREQPSVNPRWIRALRVASLLFLFLSLALTVLLIPAPRRVLPYWTLVLSLVLYPVVLWGLRSSPPKKAPLGLAVALGSLWFVVSANYASGFTYRLFQPATSQQSSLDVILPLAGSLWVLTLLHGAYAGVAWKVYRLIGRARGDLAKLVGAVVGGLVWGVLVGIAIAFLYSASQPGHHHAVGSLRTINAAEITYAATYERGYAPSLAELGPPPKGMQPSAAAAGLIDSALAGGTKRYDSSDICADLVDEINIALGRGVTYGYRFDYKPGPRDEHGRINSYTICARPIDKALYPQSFFSDESGVIRSTEEDRCPNEKDSPIAG